MVGSLAVDRPALVACDIDGTLARSDGTGDVLTVLDQAVRKLIYFHPDYDDDIATLIALGEPMVAGRAQIQHAGLAFAEIAPFGVSNALRLRPFARGSA